MTDARTITIPTYCALACGVSLLVGIAIGGNTNLRATEPVIPRPIVGQACQLALPEPDGSLVLVEMLSCDSGKDQSRHPALTGQAANPRVFPITCFDAEGNVKECSDPSTNPAVNPFSPIDSDAVSAEPKG